MAYQSFEQLEVWKRSCRLAVELFSALEACRDFGLKDQMQRAAVSIPSNIAEGYEKDSPADFIRYLRIAKGSTGELRTQLYIATELQRLPKELSTRFLQETQEISAMIYGLIKARQASLPAITRS